MSRSLVQALTACVALAGCRFHFDDVTAPGDATDGDGAPDASGSDLRVRVTGWGAVTGPGGIACADDCTYPVSGPVTLAVVAGETWMFDHFDPPCGAQPTCDAGPGQTITATFTKQAITANRVFVTSINAVLGASGRTGLDNQCATRATAGGLTGTFIALVSTSTADAVDRLTGSRGWVRLDGLPVLDQPTQLGLVSQPRGIEIDETLARQPARTVLTGSDGAGRRVAGEMCTDWTASGGNVSGGESDATGYWGISGTTAGCAGVIYCFETGKSVPVSLTPPAFPVGRYVFVSTPFDGTSGIAGADARCQSEATAASLPGTYKAVLATTTQSALDHVGSLAGPWRRPDGASVTRTGLDAGGFSTTLGMNADRTLADASPAFGASSLTTLATAAGSCNDYTTTSGFTAKVISAYRMSPFDGTVYTSSCGSRWAICVQTQ